MVSSHLPVIQGPAIQGSGTPERVWRAWARRFPVLTMTGCRRLVVVAPHPDDEVLGVGGLMCVAATAGIAVRVVAVTDGDASHPGSPTLSAADLSRLRPHESAVALRMLGLDVAITRLRVPDGQVVAHEDGVAEALRALLTDEAHGTWCVATSRGDGHPDHEATGRAAAAACAGTGARLLEYPVWTWHWAMPEDVRVPWERAYRIDLPAGVSHAKVAAVRCFRTQTLALSEHPADAPVLPAEVLGRFQRTWELVFA